MKANSIFTINPYKHMGLWVFDDESVGLDMEPFVAGMDTLCDIVHESLYGLPTFFQKFKKKEFVLRFSKNPFPTSTITMKWVDGDVNNSLEMGNSYYIPEYDLDGWCCPALFCYFDEAPKTIYLEALSV
jgi:hypothetical protein